MFIERLQSLFYKEEPILIDEILEKFPTYSKSRIFQLIKKAVEEGELVRFSKGVYYMPNITKFEPSELEPAEVIKKKFIKRGDKVFGIFGGDMLKLMFHLCNRPPKILEIISNNETQEERLIWVGKEQFIIKKSRYQINADNVSAYMIMELFSDIEVSDYKANRWAREAIIDFINLNHIITIDISLLASSFPEKTVETMKECGLMKVIRKLEKAYFKELFF